MYGVICERRRWAEVARAALVLVALLTTAGCASTGTGRWTHLDYQLGYNFPLQDRDTLSRPLPEPELVDLTPRIYLVSDNQRHELLGDPVDYFRNTLVDERVTPVAIRPPQLDLFGQDLLREMLTMSDGFVVHLGDACDISNTGEFALFAWDMQLASSGWVMAPGNHDGYFFGNSSRTVDGLIQEWNDASETYEYDGTSITSGAMQKDRYVSFYLAALILQDQVWSAQLAASIGADVEQRYRDWTARPKAGDEIPFSDYWLELNALEALIYEFADTLGDETYFLFEIDDGLAAPEQPHLRRVAWRIDKLRVWRSFILQEVELGSAASNAANEDGAVSLLLVDTSQYRVQPSIDHGIPSGILNFLSRGFVDFQIAGKTGGLHVTQYEAAQAFATSMRDEG